MPKRSILNLALLVALLALMLPLGSPTAGAVTGAIYTSQLGFFAPGDGQTPGDAKVAVLAVPAGAAVDRSFRVLGAGGAVAFAGGSGDVQPYPGGWYGNNTTGDTYLLDFSRWAPAAAGRYMVESNGLRSLPFEVSPAVYDVRRVQPLEFFRLQQSGVEISWQSLDNETSGGHGPDHRDDARQATRSDRGGGDRRLIEQDYLPLLEGHLNTAGGWFDAGDYNKYMGNTPWAAYLLLLTYEEFQSYWQGVDNNGNGEPDLLEFTKPALDWMLTMRHGDGSVYERVFNGYAAPFTGSPDAETNNLSGDSDDRPLDTDRYADITAKSAYAMATAHRVFRLVDPAAAADYLDMAVQAWDWAYAHQGTVKPKRYGGGLYFGDVEIGLTLGALELYRAQKAAGQTPDPKYADYATTHVRGHLAANDWINPSSWDYQQSYALMRYYDVGLASDTEKGTIVGQLQGRWEAGIQRQAGNAYRMNDEWLYSDFGQNDLSASSAGDALWVFDKVPDKTERRKYYDYAVHQMAWLFGRNPFGESWLASALVHDNGEYTRLPHWRLTAKHAIEGVVVPGATDRDGNRKPDYTDTGEWYYAEPTINQQAMFIRVMSALNQAAGGSSGPPPPADTPPAVSLLKPAAGAVVTGTIPVEASASDDHGVAGVSFQIDGGAPVTMTRFFGSSTSGKWQASWDTTAAPDGQHSVKVVATDTAGQQASSSATVNVNNGGMPRLHVHQIAVDLVYKGGSPKMQAKSDTLIYDAFGQPVAGATVNGHWQGAATDTFSGTTDATGKVTDYSNAATIASGITFTWVVDGVAKADWFYDAAANNQTSASKTVP